MMCTDISDLPRAASCWAGWSTSDVRNVPAGTAIFFDKGLVPALEMLGARAGLPVELCAELDDRLPEPVEAAAYYLVADALTNSAKHARASRVRVTPGIVEVTDDGVGGADLQAGSGLRGLRDRVGALGGTLELESREGEGTTLTARMPSARP